jgi:sporulation-control protein spo0M
MGVPNTKHAIGGMVINLEKPYYYPGEIVHGKIYCLFSQPYDCKSVEMEISAEEYTMFTEMKRREKAKETSINKREGRNCIYKRVQTIMVSEKNIINQGHYVYPFTFMLPLNLPGSFESYSDEHSAYIKHIVEVRALPLDPNTQAITNSILFIVRQPPQFFQYPSKMTDSKCIKICCLNKGTSSVTVSLEKNYYTTDDKVNVICELDNTKCSLDIKSIKLELFQEIILKDKNERVQNISRKVSEYSFLSYNVSKILSSFIKIARKPDTNQSGRLSYNYKTRKILVKILSTNVNIPIYLKT